MGRVRYFIVGIPINYKEYTAFLEKAQQKALLRKVTNISCTSYN